MFRKLNSAVLLLLIAAPGAWGAPPDGVRRSPEPMSAEVKEMAMQPGEGVAALAQAASRTAGPVDEQYQQLDAPSASTPTDAEREEAARFAVWNSEEMLDARRYVLEVGKRSARSSEREAQAFLNRLSALPAKQMTVWLQRLQAQRRGIAVQRAVEDEAREARMEESLALLREQEAARQSVRQWQGRSAEWLQSRFDVERFLTQERQQGRRSQPAGSSDRASDRTD